MEVQVTIQRVDPVAPMRIVLASDGSEAASVGIDLVAGIDWPEGSSIELVGAVASSALRFGGAWPTDLGIDSIRLDEQMRLVLLHELERLRERLTRPGQSVDVSVHLGRAADVILERADRVGADLIVVGSRGQGALTSMLLGSVSAEVIDQSKPPVLVARGTGIGRIVLAWDGSSCAQLAAGLLTAWPIFGASEVRVVSVADDRLPPQPWPIAPGEWEEAAMTYAQAVEPTSAHHDRLARDMAEALRAAGLTAEADRRNGDPATQLVTAATAWEADLIVMGTHGRTGLRRLVMGSVARSVLNRAPCSVLIVREPGETEEEADAVTHEAA